LTGIGEYLLAGKDDSPRSTTDDERSFRLNTEPDGGQLPPTRTD
jgi:hypothetical protein